MQRATHFHDGSLDSFGWPRPDYWSIGLAIRLTAHSPGFDRSNARATVFFLDQNLDAFEQLIIAFGIGVSGFIRFELAIFTLAAYFLMSILTLVRAVVSNVFALTYLGIGLTELRLAFFILNGLMFFFPPKPLPIAGLWLSYPELLSIAWSATMIIAFLMSVKAQLRDLSMEDQISGRR